MLVIPSTPAAILEISRQSEATLHDFGSQALLDHDFVFPIFSRGDQ